MNNRYKNDNTTIDEVKVIYDYYLNDKSIRKTAEHFNITRQKISFLFRKFNFPYLNNVESVKSRKKKKVIHTKAETQKLFNETCLKKYGVKNPRQNKEINDKIIAKRTEKYLQKLNQRLQDAECEMLEPFTRVQDKDGKYVYYTMKHKCGYVFKTDLRRDIKCPRCYYINRFSNFETRYKDFLIENNINIECNKKFGKLELDIYCPDYNIGFEFNGSYWHSVDKKGKFYHREKTEHFLKLGIPIYHFWDYQNEGIIKSIMMSKLGLSKTKYFARNLLLKTPTLQEEIDFLNQNHLEGYTKSCFRLGLYTINNKLVSLITFRSNKGELELCRFVNLINTSIVGGFSKLFKHSLDVLLNKYHTDYVISYCNRDISPNYETAIYNKYGFEFIGDTGCILKYYSKKDEKVYTRQKYQKHKLASILNKFNADLTADENLIENNIFPIRNSGNWKFIYKRKVEI